MRMLFDASCPLPSPAAMFAAAPFVIADAPYEATMGLVQKIFYYHMPSAWMFLLGGDRLRRRERALSVQKRPRADRTGARGGRAAVLFGLLTLVTGPLWARKAWGVWWVWDARLTSSLVCG